MSLTALATVIALQNQRIASLTGNIEKLAGFESKVLQNRRNITVYLPPQYRTESERRFPVLYMHDGQNIIDGSTSYIPNQEWRADEAAEALIGAGLIEPIIIVGIDNGGMERANEYLPWKIKMGNSETGGKADLYGTMIIGELMPLINAKYRTKTGANNTGLLGSSFGGVITSYLGITRPDVFGKLGIVSPSVWVSNRALLSAVKPVKNRQRIWIDMGTKEGAGAVSDATALFDAYKAAGWKAGKDITLVIDGNAEHNELAWSRRMMSILTYLFGRK
ncbi:MAG: esterase [Armatimonadetes bacterium Cent15-Ar3]|nr:MAG: esterase [Armatimonadetes bacterium Cent15-Ar3]